MLVISSRPRSYGTPTWLYLRITLGHRDVEELLAEQGLEVSTRRISGHRNVC
jgi:hypothetical protein